MKFKQHSHPFAITFCQIVIHCYNMHSLSWQSIKINWQSSNQSLSFPCCHFSNFSLMQHSSSNQLHIVVNHIPFHWCSPCNPNFVKIGFVSRNINIIFYCGKIFVIFSRCNLYLFIFCKSFCSFFYNGKGLW